MTDQPYALEIELIERIKRQDQNALRDLHERYHRLLYNMAAHVLGDAAAAEEVIQDVLFQVWRWPERWNPDKGRLTSWLLSVTRYTAIDRLRRERRQPPLHPHSLDMLANRLARSVDSDPRDDGRLLRRLIRTLPQDQRQLIHLAFFRGMTHSEIAEHLGLPLGTVKSRIRLGMQKLRDLWQNAADQPVENEREQE